MSERALLTDDERTVLMTDNHDDRDEVIDAIEARITEGFAAELVVLDDYAPEVFDHLIGVVDDHLANRYRDRTDGRATSAGTS